MYLCLTNSFVIAGIIGGGISGASAAYASRKLFGEDASLDIYEFNQIGGRLQTVEIDGRHYECGGNIIHPKNMYMVNLTKSLGQFLQRVIIGWGVRLLRNKSVW